MNLFSIVIFWEHTYNQNIAYKFNNITNVSIYVLSKKHSVVSTDNYRGYELLASDKFCAHWNGNAVTEAHRCRKSGVTSCREECNTLTACVGYSEQPSANNCYLFTSGGLCPDGWDKQDGTVARRGRELVKDSGADAAYNCYRKSMKKMTC